MLQSRLNAPFANDRRSRLSQRMLLALSAGLALAGAFPSSLAYAGPVEQLVEVAFGPGAAPVIVARFANGGGGLIYGTDGGRRWQLQCGAALPDPNAKSNGPLLILDNGTLLLATSQGIVAGKSNGCGFVQEALMQGGQVVDLVADPSDPRAAFALVTLPRTSTATASTSVLQRRSADGVWSTFGKPQAVIATSLRVAVQDGRVRVYEAVLVPVQDEDAGTQYFTYNVRYSDDGALSFHDFPLQADSAPRVVGVDPTNPDRIVVLIDRSSAADRILISHDRGATLKPYLELGQYGGLAFAPDGRVWIGGSALEPDGEQGVWAAPNLATAPVRLAGSDYPVQCLGYQAAGDKLYACQHFWLGSVELGSGTFERQLSFGSVDALVSCEGSDSVALCEAQLCNAYCGPSHFAPAPVCAVYNKPTCGVPVAMQESGVKSPSPIDAGPPAVAGGAAVIPVSAVDAGTAPITSPAADGGSSVTPHAARGTCAVAAVSGSDSAFPWIVLLGLGCARARRRPATSGDKDAHNPRS